MESPSLEAFRKYVDVALEDIFSGEHGSAAGLMVGLVDLQSPNLKDSVIL